MSKLDKDEVIASFTAAYEAANGKAPTVEAKGGWYSVDGGKNMRLAALAELTAQLSGGDSAEAPEAKKPAKKAAKKPAKAAKPAPSTGNGPTVVSTGDGLKPSDLWKQRLEDNQGNVLPRGI